MTLIGLSFDAWKRNRRTSEEDWLSFLAALAPIYGELLTRISGWNSENLVVAEYYCERAMVGRILSWFDEDGWWVQSKEGAPISAARICIQKSMVWNPKTLRSLTPMFRSYELPNQISFDGWAMPSVEEAAL